MKLALHPFQLYFIYIMTLAVKVALNPNTTNQPTNENTNLTLGGSNLIPPVLSPNTALRNKEKKLWSSILSSTFDQTSSSETWARITNHSLERS